MRQPIASIDWQTTQPSDAALIGLTGGEQQCALQGALIPEKLSVLKLGEPTPWNHPSTHRPIDQSSREAIGSKAVNPVRLTGFLRQVFYLETFCSLGQGNGHPVLQRQARCPRTRLGLAVHECIIFAALNQLDHWQIALSLDVVRFVAFNTFSALPACSAMSSSSPRLA